MSKFNNHYCQHSKPEIFCSICNKDQTDVSHIDEGEINEPIGNTDQLPKPFMTIFDAPHTVWKVGFNCHGNDLSKHIGTHLYTHPMRELTDEEIIEISHKALEQSGLTKETNFMVVFARAILKKASEK